jgi:uncharacterized protein YmfQ (DUF2313 family)
MALSAEDYQAQAKALLPKGKAWATELASKLSDFLLGLGDELARVDFRAVQLLDEMDPRTTEECLEDWERNFGLPDNCGTPPDTVQARRNAILAKMNSTGGQTPQYFINRAAELGFTITITEFRPFRADAGLANGPCYSETWAYWWQVNAPLNTILEFKADESRAEERLRTWGNNSLECLINKYKPAHTGVIFSYT